MRSLCPNLQSRPSPQLWASVDADVAAWRAAIFANGGTVSPDAVRAVNTFTRGLKADGLWPLIIDMGILCGVGNLNAALVKLKTAPGVSRILTNTNFVGADYTATGAGAGLAGNGINKSLLSEATDMLVTNASCALGVYITQLNDDATSTGPGLLGLGAALPYTEISPGRHRNVTSAIAGSISGLDVTGGGYVVSSRVSQVDVRAYQNGAQIGIDTGSVAAYVPGGNALTIFRINRGGTFPSSSRMGAYFFGFGLTPAQVAALSARVNTLMTAFGANVY